MPTEIEILLRELEAESANLSRMIKEAVAEGEYLVAHYHAEALALVTQKLQTLKNLEDKFYEQKKTLRMLIRGSQRTMNRDYSAGFKKYLQDEISKHKKELEELERVGKIPRSQSHILEEHLQLLLEKKLRYVKVILMKSAGFLLVIRRTRTGVKISIPNLRSLHWTNIINDENLVKFTILGFRKTEDQKKLVLPLSGDRAELIGQLKMVILKIAFEFFYFAQFENDTFIESGV